MKARSLLHLLTQLLIMLLFVPPSAGAPKCCFPPAEEASAEAALKLMHCVDEESAVKTTTNPRQDVVTIIQHSTTNIIASYAAHAHVVNLAYARARGYDYRVLNASGSNHEPLDPRWNKVKILLLAVEEAMSFPQASFIVWLDSDLVVLHHSLELESIIKNHPAAQLILSRDPRIENGVANTGCIIVRVSQFASQFLSRWWSEEFGARSAGMDQHVFARLYDSLLDKEKDMVALLPPSAINSDHPVWQKHSLVSPVLHLVGMSSLVRSELFREAYAQVCNHDGASTANIRISIDAAAIEAVVFNVSLRREAETKLLSEADAIAESVSRRGADRQHTSQLLQSLEAIEARARDLRQRGYGAEPTSTCADGGSPDTEGAIQWSILRSLQALVSEEDITDKKLRMSLLQLLAGVGLDILAMKATSENGDGDNHLFALIEELLPVVDELLKLAPTLRRPHVLYYKFKLLEARARRLGVTNRADANEQETAALEAALNVWREMSTLGWHGNGNGLLDPHREMALLKARLGSLQCSTGRAVEGTRSLEDAVSAMELAWKGTAELPLPILDSLMQALVALTGCQLQLQQQEQQEQQQRGHVIDGGRAPHALTRATRLYREQWRHSSSRPRHASLEDELLRLCRHYGLEEQEADSQVAEVDRGAPRRKVLRRRRQRKY